MSQHDYNLANASGASFRSDLNNVLAAIASVNSGSGSPGTTFAGQVWEDTSTTPSTYKLRNAANNAWISLFKVDADGNFSLVSTGSVDVPSGTTAQRTGSPNSGMIRFNTDLSQYEGYDGSAWLNLSAPTGKILQVVNAETTTIVSNSNENVFADTTLTASITPSFTSSKILIFVSQSWYSGVTGNSAFNGIRLLRDSTVIYEPNFSAGTGGSYDYGIEVVGATSMNHYGRANIIKLDSPSTTSAITYKTQGRPYLYNIVYYQVGGQVGYSTITLMEVAA